MEENGAAALPMDVGSEAQIIEEGPRVCPLCSSEVRLFFINYHEKFMMCESTVCEYPFGHEDLLFVPYEDADDEIEDMGGSTTGRRSSVGSEVSTSGWSDIERLNRLCDNDDNRSIPSETSSVIDITKIKRTDKKKISKDKKEKEIQKNVQDLRGLTMELNDMSKPSTKIKNEEWIRNLKYLQEQSGLKLLKPGESKQTNADEDHSEVKIDIQPGTSGMVPSINIQIANNNE